MQSQSGRRRFSLDVERVPSLAGCVLIAYALICLLTGFVQESAPRLLGFELLPIKANVALSFGFVGLALIRRDQWDEKVYSIIVWAIGALTLLEYLLRVDFGIDQLLFRDRFSAIMPGRMALLTSVGFVLSGTALAVMRSKRRSLRDLSRALAFVVGGIGVVTLLGYSFAAQSMYQLNPNRNVSFLTALGFVVAAAGVEYCNFSEGLVRRIHASNHAGKALRRLLPVAILLPYLIILAVNAAQAHLSWNKSFSQAVTAGSIVFALVWAVFIYAREIGREEAARQESEVSFRLVADTAPVMIWRTSADKLCDYVNKPWLEFTGRSIEQELGNGWAEGIHAADRNVCIDTYESSFDKRIAYSMRYRMRRNDGEYRWLLDTGVPRFDLKGKFAGYIGSCIDITEQKLAEEALADFGRRLLLAQEDERTWIAREIQDDFQQRLALLSLRMQQILQNPDLARGEIIGRLTELLKDVNEFCADLHSLACRLHSSALNLAGLVPGLRSLCSEFTDDCGISVSFEAENVPSAVAEDIAICLFRVTQEALQNIKKHSGASCAEVRVEGRDGKIHLSISDKGKGFNPDAIAIHGGIGIRSMKERVRHLGGYLELSTRPEEGSRLSAWIPIRTHLHSLNELAVGK